MIEWESFRLLTLLGAGYKMNYATEKEMIEHCEKYPCSTCIIAYKCSLFEKIFGYLPNTPNQPLQMTPNSGAFEL